MEIHHHSHTARKKWTHYFWEFFMLFLAVFCGFLAEIQVEHYVEHQREKKFLAQLLLNLNSDEANLNVFISGQVNQEKKIDSLYQLIKNKEFGSKGNDLYFFARSVTRYPNYVPSDGTITQLKFGGNLRLIKSDKIVSAILDYDSYTRILTEFIGTSSQNVLNYRNISEEVFDAKIFHDMVDEKDGGFVIIRPTNNPQILASDPQKLNVLLMRLVYVNGGCKRSISLAKKLLNKEIALKKNIEEIY